MKPLRALVAATTLLLVALLQVFPVLASDQESGGRSGGERVLDRLHRHEESIATSGQTARKAQNFRLLGHSPLTGRAAHADVFFYDHEGDVGKYAYVGSWGAPCSGTGVKVVDVNNPRRPRLVGVVGSAKGVSNEDMVVRRIGDTDVLAIGVQPCGEGGVSGLALWDVSSPRVPRELAFFETPGGVHELDLVVRKDGRALALLAVPFAEFENVYFDGGVGGDFRIVDVTNPSAPVELATWGIIADSNLEIFGGNDQISSPYQGLGYFAAHYAHSVRGADGGRTAYVSYWDGGVLKFDISNPSRPQLLARTFFGPDDDGDAHSMTPYEVGGRRYILQNDEDSNPLSPVLVRSSATGKRRFSGIDEPWAPTLLSQRARALRGRVHDAGDGCQASDFAGAQGKIALVDTVDPFYVDIIEDWEVPCELSGQVIRAARAGAKAVLLNLISPDDAWPFEPEKLDRVQEVAAGMPIVQVSDIDDLADAIRRSLRQRSVIVRLDPTTPSFGYLRIFDEGIARDVNGDGVPEYRQVGAFFRLPQVRGELEPPPGTWTIHNTEVLGRTAYSSWYSHGIVALDVGSPRRPRKVGQFVPPASARLEEIFGPPGSEVWGVAIDPETNVVYASDMRSGLWIIEPRGPAAS